MSSDLADIVGPLTAIQKERRQLTAHAADGGSQRQPPRLGCRLLHWDPELEHFRSEVIPKGKRRGFIVYEPLDVRIESRPHVFFARVYKVKYAGPGRKRTEPGLPERQYGMTYSFVHAKREVTRILDAFKRCADDAGAIIGSVKERLQSVLPAQTLAAKNKLHRWIFTIYDVAWQAPPGSPRSATKYIPMKGFDAVMNTDESVLYDRDHIRSTPWSTVERRLDPNRWGSYSHFEACYAAWGEELPEYYASRIDDVVQASDWTIDWLVRELQDGS